MSAFNDLNGVPTGGNPFTLRQVLRDEWKFDGFVVSDWDSVTEMISHGYAADAKDAALKGVRGGVDMEMSSTTYYDNLKSLVDAGQLDPKLIDESVKNILRIKFRMGLFDRVATAGKPMIAVILAGRPLTFQELTGKVNAVLYAWHPGTMGGPAIADIVFGDKIPSGKLTATFPCTVGQVPIYYAHMNTGRPHTPDELGIPMGSPVNPKGYTSKYLDVDFTPEYPFGFGLSYTKFEYSGLHVSGSQVHLGATFTLSAEVANTGTYEADEIVQLYVRDLVGSLSRPVRELKAFQRVPLKNGEKQTVQFTLGTNDLAFYREGNQLVTEPGRFQVWIAPDSASGLKGEFEVVK